METFDYTYKNNHEFVIGYSHIVHDKPSGASFLFQTCRIIFIKEGMVDWKIGNKIHTLSSGDIALFNNMMPRKIVKIYNNQPLIYDLFGFSPCLLTDPLVSSFFYGDHCKVMTVENKNSNQTYFLLHALKNEILTENKYKKDSIEKLLHIILIHIARGIDISITDKCNQNHPQMILAYAIQYIQNHLASNLTVSNLANMYGYSCGHFSRLFKKHIGISVNRYIVSARIENVLQMISTENCTVLSAAFKSGFNTSSGFYKAYKKYNESSPLH
ncbi:MAG TPA: hypothetical protein DCY74_01330 [Clostridiales bacterium]|jgi:AraC-like DNA-binding protein|nr:hypothetical protein [Clostridiales bacterium]HCG34775.1 hypothetical protein [Clostridiales bacterium]